MLVQRQLQTLVTQPQPHPPHRSVRGELLEDRGDDPADGFVGVGEDLPVSFGPAVTRARRICSSASDIVRGCHLERYEKVRCRPGRTTVDYLKRHRFNQARLRCLLVLGGLALPRLTLWIAVSFAQTVFDRQALSAGACGPRAAARGVRDQAPRRPGQGLLVSGHRSVTMLGPRREAGGRPG